MAKRGRKRIKVNEIEKYLLYDMQEQYGVTMEEIEALVDKKGGELVDLVKRDSPSRPHGGQYKKNWKVRKEGLKTAHYKNLIYNDKHYRITHLLEYGHASRDGGRVRAYPHLADNEEKVTKEFLEEMEKLFAD